MASISKLGIIAGGGDIPQQVVKHCQANSIPFFVVALQSHAQKKLTKGIPHMWARLGEVGAILQAFKKEKVKEIVMIGNVHRPSLGEIRPDWEGVKIIASIAKKALGDDSLLRAIVNEIEKRGFVVVGIDSILPELLATAGTYGKIKPKKEDMKDINRGIEVASTLGLMDVGQSVAIQDGLVLAVEAIEGTDAMIERTGKLKRNTKGPVLVKLKKPLQDSRVDLPTIGKETVVRAAEQGFAGIAVQAGGILVVDREEVVAEANKRGLFIIGVEVKR